MRNMLSINPTCAFLKEKTWLENALKKKSSEVAFFFKKLNSSMWLFFVITFKIFGFVVAYIDF